MLQKEVQTFNQYQYREYLPFWMTGIVWLPNYRLLDIIEVIFKKIKSNLNWKNKATEFVFLSILLVLTWMVIIFHEKPISFEDCIYCVVIISLRNDILISVFVRGKIIDIAFRSGLIFSYILMKKKCIYFCSNNYPSLSIIISRLSDGCG